MFESADGRSANRDDTARSVESLIDGRGGGRRNGVRLRVDFVIFDAFDADRLKSSQTNVKGDLDSFDAALANAVEDLRREMKSRSGRGDGAAMSGVDGLIAIEVAGRIRARDVWRKGHVPDAIEDGIEIADWLKTDSAFTEFGSSKNFGFQFIVLAEK